MTSINPNSKNGALKQLSESSIQEGYRFLQELIRDFTKSKLFSWRNAQQKAEQVLKDSSDWEDLRRFYQSSLPENRIGVDVFKNEFASYPECIAVFFHDVICEYLLDEKSCDITDLLQNYININLQPYHLSLELTSKVPGNHPDVHLSYGNIPMVSVFERFPHALDPEELFRKINMALSLQGIQFILSKWVGTLKGIQMYRVEDFLQIQEKYTDNIDYFLSLSEFLYHLTGNDSYERNDNLSFTLSTEGQDSTLQMPSINFESYSQLALELRQMPSEISPDEWLEKVLNKYNLNVRSFKVVNGAWLNLFSQDPGLLKKFFKSFKKLNVT